MSFRQILSIIFNVLLIFCVFLRIGTMYTKSYATSSKQDINVCAKFQADWVISVTAIARQTGIGNLNIFRVSTRRFH